MNQPSASNMKRAAAMTLLPAIILVILSTFVFTSSATCPNVPTMKMDDVCNELRVPEWTHACWVTLNSSALPKTAELTDYVIMAARNSSLRYEGTLNKINELLTAGQRLTDKEREAYSFCKDQYAEAGRLMANWVHQLSRCDFTHITNEDPIQACVDNLQTSLGEEAPLFNYVEADENLAMVMLYLLGQILTGKCPGC